MSDEGKNLLQVTPVMHVADVGAAVRYFVDLLGFSATVQGPTYAYVEREDAAVRIMQASDSPGEVPGAGTRAFRYYFDVRDVVALAKEIEPKLRAAGMPESASYGPVDQRWGQREYMILAPDGDLVVFGQET